MTRLPARSLLALPLVVAALLYGAFWSAVGSDMTKGYGAWLGHLARLAPGRTVAVPFGDHITPIPYLLAPTSLGHGLLATAGLVYLACIVATGLLAVSVGRLSRTLGVARPWILAAFVPLLPGVAFGASPTASGGALWAAPCVLALAAAVDRRSMAMLAWFGVALAFDRQAACLAPFMLGLLLARRVPVRCWAACPAGYLATVVPAWLAGAPLVGVIGRYAQQTGIDDQLSHNAPNVWVAIEMVPGATSIPLSGLALAAALGAATWLTARVTTLRFDPTTFAAAALLSPLLVVGLLPGMHEGCFFLGDVLALAWAGVAGTRAAALDAALVQAGSTLGILACMSGAGSLAAWGAVPMLLASIRVARTLLLRRAANDNSVPTGYPVPRPRLGIVAG